MTAKASTALAAWPWQVAGEMLKWIADGDPMKLLIPIAVGEKSIAFPRRSVNAGVDRTHKLCFSSVRPSIPGQPALHGGPQRRGARAGGGPLSGGGAPAPPERRGDPGERAGVSEGNGYTLRAASAPQAGDAPSSAVILRRISTDEKHALLRACFLPFTAGGSRTTRARDIRPIRFGRPRR